MTNFLHTDLYPFLKPLEDNWEQIKTEFLGIPKDDFEKYFVDELHNGKWKVWGLYYQQQWFLEHMQQCPKTTELIQQIPGLSEAGFSILEAGAKLEPHVGWTDQFMRCHLPLICTPKAYLSVEGEQYIWTEGKIVVFDDMKEHYAVNESDIDRVVLIVDFKK